ncbi:hypothetical protein NDU88_000075 [Pleurodeles waltl]|uniref:Uncharacterized protein n=1 Tax=Pleurodeles waltl TaxID=8319 RepID=A0AAV7KM30_PLEWA|nr:hypothetical protein NDU88_000075 [Pleurodeles waltl]
MIDGSIADIYYAVIDTMVGTGFVGINECCFAPNVFFGVAINGSVTDSAAADIIVVDGSYNGLSLSAAEQQLIKKRREGPCPSGAPRGRLEGSRRQRAGSDEPSRGLGLSGAREPLGAPSPGERPGRGRFISAELQCLCCSAILCPSQRYTVSVAALYCVRRSALLCPSQRNTVSAAALHCAEGVSARAEPRGRFEGSNHLYTPAPLPQHDSDFTTSGIFKPPALPG